jgi:hypothetical protein
LIIKKWKIHYSSLGVSFDVAAVAAAVVVDDVVVV